MDIEKEQLRLENITLKQVILQYQHRDLSAQIQAQIQEQMGPQIQAQLDAQNAAAASANDTPGGKA